MGIFVIIVNLFELHTYVAFFFLLQTSEGKQKYRKTTTKLPPVSNTTEEFVPAMMPQKGLRDLPPPSIGPPTNLESPCEEPNVIFVLSSFPVSGITDCQTLCKVAKSCEFFTFISGNCGIRCFNHLLRGPFIVLRIYRTYSPKAYINASPLQKLGTKTEIPSPILDGKVFVGQALEILGGNSLDCQRSCQRDYNCISWTWNEEGGLNPEICVHNYGITQRKLTVPTGSKIISGPKFCRTGKLNDFVNLY